MCQRVSRTGTTRNDVPSYAGLLRKFCIPRRRYSVARDGKWILRKAVAASATVSLILLSVIVSSARTGLSHRLMRAKPGIPDPSAHSRAEVDKQTRLALPLAFEPNRGQAGSDAKFVSRSGGMFASFGARAVTFHLRGSRHSDSAGAAVSATRGVGKNSSRSDADIQMSFAGTDSAAGVSVSDPVQGRSNYFIGNDPRRWLVGIPHYAQLKYPQVYPGIDVVFHGTEADLEFDFVVAAGADPSAISINFKGVQKVVIESGVAVLRTSAGDLRLRPPVMYQESNGGRQQILGRFVS